MQLRRRVWADPAILWAAGVTLTTVVFGRFQNEGHLVGGDISAAKTLWLNLTIVSFVVFPAVWWREGSLDPRMRRIFGVIFASFAARGAIELPILYLTDWWHCSYGMAHDLATAGAVLWLWARSGVRDARSVGLLWFVVALMFVEAGFAYAFCSVVDPASGIYFAADEARFEAINRVTWWAVGAGYPILAVLVWRYAESRGRLAQRESAPWHPGR